MESGWNSGDSTRSHQPQSAGHRNSWGAESQGEEEHGTGGEVQTCLTFPAQRKALRLDSERVEEAGVSEATGSGQGPDYRPYRPWAKGFKLPVEQTRDQALHNAGTRQRAEAARMMWMPTSTSAWQMLPSLLTCLAGSQQGQQV